jgi:hypothetical protein
MASPVARADTIGGSYQVATARASAPVGLKGETFYTADFYVGRNAGAGPVTLSGSADGTASFWVDDVAEVTVTHSDGTTATRSFDDSDECTATTVLVTPRTDVTSLFNPGLNRVHVRFSDSCGGNDGNTPVFLSGAGLVVTTMTGSQSLPFLDAGTFIRINYYQGTTGKFSLGEACTTSFNVKNASGVRYSLTAKHCIDGEEGDQADNSTIALHQPMAINTSDDKFSFARQLSCAPPTPAACLLPPENTGRDEDMVAWRPDTSVPSNMVQTGYLRINHGLLPVLGTAEWQNVSQLCHFGSGTGGESCAPGLTGLEEWYACHKLFDCSGGIVIEPGHCVPGDSGSPMYAYQRNSKGVPTGVRAVGLVIQGDAQHCAIIPIQRVLSELKVKLVT